MTREELIEQILEEREMQDAKWGEQNHTPIEWISILTEEVGEASKEALELHFANYSPDAILSLKRYREEMIQVCAVAFAMIECVDRHKWIMKVYDKTATNNWRTRNEKDM